MDRVQELVNEDMPLQEVLQQLTERGKVEFDAAVNRARQASLARRLAEHEQMIATMTNAPVEHSSPGVGTEG